MQISFAAELHVDQGRGQVRPEFAGMLAGTQINMVKLGPRNRREEAQPIAH